MLDVHGKVEGARHFMMETVWHDPPGASRLKMFSLYALRVCFITFNGLRDKMILLRASALSYSTLFAVVPVLAVGLAMLKGLGVQTQMEENLLEYLTAQQEEIARQISSYIANTDFKALGALGTGFLIVAVIAMLSTVEGTFNDIWGVTKNRQLSRKITDYISVLILGPLLLVISATMISSLSETTAVRILSQYPLFSWIMALVRILLSYSGIWIAFTAMYLLMPNTRVKVLPAVIAGIACGTLWELAFLVYTDFYVGVVRYNRIYGTFAVLPIFIIWIFVSWVIVLIGAQMSNAIQHIRSYQQEYGEISISPEEEESIAFYLMVHIAGHFAKGKPPVTVEQLSNTLSVPIRTVREILDKLHSAGLLEEVTNSEQFYLPGRDLRRIGLSEIYHALRKSGAYQWRLPDQAGNEGLEKLLQELKARTEGLLETRTLDELVHDTGS